MDFHKLTRRELQALCKKNKIPANTTNVAMVDALASLPQVEGLEDLLNPDSSANPEIGSPNVTTTVRRASRRKPITNEPESAQTVTRTTRRSTRRGVTEEVPETPAAQTNRKIETMASTRKKLDTQLGEEKENDQSAVQRSTRRSVRLSEKKIMEKRKTEGLKMNPIKIDELCEDLSKDLKINESEEDVGIIPDEVSAKSEMVDVVLSEIADNEIEFKENVAQKIENGIGFGINSDEAAVPDGELMNKEVDEEETHHETNLMEGTEESNDGPDNLPSENPELNINASPEKIDPVKLSVVVVPSTAANPTEVLEVVVQDISAEEIINSEEAGDDGVLKFSGESVADGIEVEVKSLEMEFQDKKGVSIAIPGEEDHHGTDGIDLSDFDIVEELTVEGFCDEKSSEVQENLNNVNEANAGHLQILISDEVVSVAKSDEGFCDEKSSEVQENLNNVNEANAEHLQILISDEVVSVEKSEVILERYCDEKSSEVQENLNNVNEANSECLQTLINSEEAGDDGVLKFSGESVADGIEVEVKSLEMEFQDNKGATIAIPGEEDHHGTDGIDLSDFDIVEELIVEGFCDEKSSEVQENLNNVNEANAEHLQTLISDEVVSVEKSEVILENAVNDSATVHAIVADLEFVDEMNSETPTEDPIDSADDFLPNPEKSATITQVSEVVEENFAEEPTDKSPKQLDKCPITMKLSDDATGNMANHHISHVLKPKQQSSREPTTVQTVSQVSGNKENVDNSGTVVMKNKEENPVDLQKASLRQLKKMFKQKLQITDGTNMKKDENDVKVEKPRPALESEREYCIAKP